LYFGVHIVKSVGAQVSYHFSTPLTKAVESNRMDSENVKNNTCWNRVDYEALAM